MDIQKIITTKLKQTFSPSFIEVIDESNNHNVPKGSQSHFRVTLVTDAFTGKPLIQRHRWVNTLLKTELAESIHALTLHTFTSDEWMHKGEKVKTSPPCQGGGK